jgi:hypothetical protein
MKNSRLLIVGVAVILIAIAAGGFAALHDQTSGPKVLATVDECHHVGGYHGGSTECSGSWVVGGSLLGNGHVEVGDIIGAGSSDVGKNMPARAHGNNAYTTTSYGVPIALFSTDGAILLVAGLVALQIRRGRKRTASTA